jgi:putative ABC transport system permease protein
VEAAARIGQVGTLSIRKDETQTQVRQYLTADPAFARLFDWPTVDGDLASTLGAPNRVAVTPDMARELFGRTDIAGETLDAGMIGTLEVGAVVEVPENSSLQFRMLLSESTILPLLPDEMMAWDAAGWGTYLHLAPGASMDRVEHELNRILHSNLPDDAAATRSVALQPLTAVYLSSGDVEATFVQNSARASTLYALIAVGALILLIAGINYTSLATAQSLRRGREVGVRKTLGLASPRSRSSFSPRLWLSG